jgi:hypothetical protein
MPRSFLNATFEGNFHVLTKINIQILNILLLHVLCNEKYEEEEKQRIYIFNVFFN